MTDGLSRMDGVVPLAVKAARLQREAGHLLV